jgi:hypothetical protein
MENSESSFIDPRLNISSLIGIALFLLSEILGIFTTKHSVLQFIRFCIFWVYIHIFPTSETAKLVGNMSTTDQSITTKKIFDDADSTILEIRPLD